MGRFRTAEQKATRAAALAEEQNAHFRTIRIAACMAAQMTPEQAATVKYCMTKLLGHEPGWSERFIKSLAELGAPNLKHAAELQAIDAELGAAETELRAFEKRLLP